MTVSGPGISTFRSLPSAGRNYGYFSLRVLEELGYVRLERLPNTLKLLLENLLRNYELGRADFDEILTLSSWQPKQASRQRVHFRPRRILMQDFTGVPSLVDLAALRDAVVSSGGDASRVNPRIPVDLVIDHSVVVEHFNPIDGLQRNMALEFERNSERYRFLRWAQEAFENLRIVPPGGGICHQINLEYLAEVVSRTQLEDGETLILPDSLVGTDSHTTMVNALGVLGWGVGGIEAEAALLGRPVEILIPEVIGVRLSGHVTEGTGAADIALTLTQALRQEGIGGAFVEFFGDGLNELSLADRATLANMAPEYGATCALFPHDDETLSYLSATGRNREQSALVESYAKAQGWWRYDGVAPPEFSRTIDFNLGQVSPCLAGPRRPQDRITVTDLKESFNASFVGSRTRERHFPVAGTGYAIRDGSVVLAAITSCTNTSNPTSMITAGLLARNAVARGLKSKPWVRTSLALGSVVVSEYLNRLGFQESLNALGFGIGAYGCAACVGNIAPLEKSLASTIEENDLNVVAVLSGNRNFEGRINPLIRANYLASPALVIAYALAGTVYRDFTRDALGLGEDAEPVYLRDIWPNKESISAAMSHATTSQMYCDHYASIFAAPPAWREILVAPTLTYDWDDHSTYIRRPPFLEHAATRLQSTGKVSNARILLLLGDGVTTDHISPAGPIGLRGPTADYLRERKIEESHFNSYGSRRGNHEVMLRGAFSNMYLRNEMLPETLGGFARLLPDDTVMSVFDAAARYRETQTPLVILAGKDYGGGSSRDWAAKATALLGVKVVIAESFERIHRANLIAVGVLPLQFVGSMSWRSLGIDGTETLLVVPQGGKLSVHCKMTLSVMRAPLSIQEEVTLQCRIDTLEELDTYRAGGLLPLVLQVFRTEAHCCVDNSYPIHVSSSVSAARQS